MQEDIEKRKIIVRERQTPKAKESFSKLKSNIVGLKTPKIQFFEAKTSKNVDESFFA